MIDGGAGSWSRLFAASSRVQTKELRALKEILDQIDALEVRIKKLEQGCDCKAS